MKYEEGKDAQAFFDAAHNVLRCTGPIIDDDFVTEGAISALAGSEIIRRLPDPDMEVKP